MEYIEKLREKLNKLVLKENNLSVGEVLEVSQQLDKLICKYYNTTLA
ncbi:aspartyl-phosphate phosphatase Spo0E family protein [Clostridium lundense]|nr:aspartyl-phosphate phosphatase Spo0E family protein [Clostridium lundense]